MNNELYLAHHGIKGMKWGVRRYQNSDGSLTPAGKKRQAKLYQKELNKHEAQSASLYGAYHRQKQATLYVERKYNKIKDSYNALTPEERQTRKARRLRAKGEKWLSRYESSSKYAADLDRQYYESLVKQSEIGKQISSDSNFITSFDRSRVYTTGDRAAKKEYEKANGKIYWHDTANSPTDVGYDRTRVHVNNEANKKKYSKSSKQRRQGYQLYRTEVYYY